MKKEKKLFLWIVSRQDFSGYDEYSAFVVVSESESLARHYHPSGLSVEVFLTNATWPVDPDNLLVEKIGAAIGERVEGEIILSSFNAG